MEFFYFKKDVEATFVKMMEADQAMENMPIDELEAKLASLEN